MSPTNQRQAIRANGRWLHGKGPRHSSAHAGCLSYRFTLLPVSVRVSQVTIMTRGDTMTARCAPNTNKSTPVDNAASWVSQILFTVYWLSKIDLVCVVWTLVALVRVQKEMKEYRNPGVGKRVSSVCTGAILLRSDNTERVCFYYIYESGHWRISEAS
jgi:hypothetical protein